MDIKVLINTLKIASNNAGYLDVLVDGKEVTDVTYSDGVCHVSTKVAKVEKPVEVVETKKKV